MTFKRNENSTVDCIYRIKHFCHEEESVYKNITNISSTAHLKFANSSENRPIQVRSAMRSMHLQEIYMITIDYEDGSFNFPSFDRLENNIYSNIYTNHIIILEVASWIYLFVLLII